MIEKTVAISLVVAAGLACAAVETGRPRRPPTPAEARARWEAMMAHTGGPVEKPGVGKITVINAQDKAGDAVIAGIAGKLAGQTRIAVEVVRSGWRMYERPAGSDAVIVVADDAALPVSVIAVENQWGLLNVAKLGEANFDVRFAKEFIRVTTLAFGGALSRFGGSALNPVRDVSMLDRYVCENYTVDNRDAIVRTLSALGVVPSVRVSYRKACEEGWAPAPTNDVQRAVWDEVKSGRARGATAPARGTAAGAGK